MILSGSRTGSPRLILSTFSMPETTLPQTVYWRLRKAASPKQMKNCELAESGLAARAIDTVPRTCGSALNSALRSGYFDPPRPGSLGTTGLRHEPVDHAVEDDAVVESFGDQALDVRDMAWRKRRVHFDHHRALARLER